MFIGHLPAGYMLTTWLQRRTGNHSRRLLLTGLIASILPDIDLLLFYGVHGRQFHHHHYLTHLPLFWMSLGFAAWALAVRFRRKALFPYILVFTLGTLLHMVLDTTFGSIRWLYPFSDKASPLIVIQPRYHWWVWNFILHWTFLLEILMIAAAIRVYKRRCPKPS